MKIPQTLIQRTNDKVHRCSTIVNLCFITAILIGLQLTITGCAETKISSKSPGSCETKKEILCEITKGPYLLRLLPNRAALMWETDRETTGKIYYGKDKRLNKTASAGSIAVRYEKQTEDALTDTNAYIHKTWLEDLQPGRKYYYRIGNQSKTYSFLTPSGSTDKVRFAVYGDCRTYPDRHRRIVRQIIKKDVDFVVVSGDLVEDGGEYQQWKQQFFGPLEGLAESVPVYALKGNHDLSEQDYFEKLLTPAGKLTSFSFDYSPLHFYCADNYTGEPEEILSEIAKDFRSSKRTWNILSYHEPTLNFGGHFSRWGAPNAMPTYSEIGVDFVLAGHSHLYERFRPVAPKPGTDGNYVTYITSAGGGAPLYGVEQTKFHVQAQPIHHFCLFEVRGNKLTMDTIDIDGNVIDHLELTKTAEGLNEQYRRSAVPMSDIQMYRDLHSVELEPLFELPKKGEPFEVAYEMDAPEIAEDVKLRFSLSCEDGSYKLPEPKHYNIGAEGDFFEDELTATALTETKRKLSEDKELLLIDPPLWLQCDYRAGRMKGKLRWPVFLEFNED